MLPDFTTIINQAAEAFDDLITQGVTCSLIYQGVLEPCSNCVYDHIGKKSSGRYRTGGPLQFPDGTVCPMCHNAGNVRTTEYTEDIKMTIDFNLTGEKKKFPKTLTNIRFTDTTIRTRGLLTDMPKLQKCVEMRINDASSPYNNWRYTMASEPTDDFVFVRNKYFTVYWERAG